MNRRRLLPLILLLSCFSIPLFAVDKSFSISEYLLSYPKTALDAPKYFALERIELPAMFAFGVSAFYLIDPVQEGKPPLNGSKQIDSALSVVGGFGDARYVFPALGATALGAYFADADELMEATMTGIKSALISSAVTYTLKAVVQRPRPTGNPKSIGIGFDISQDDSFPSGHSTIAWSLAPVVAAYYPDSKWSKPLAYTLATLVSFSRVAQQKHWKSDVFAGAMIGYSTAQLCLKDQSRITLTFLEDGTAIAGFWDSW